MPSYGLGRVNDAAFDFNLPSGNVCLMKHADLQSLIAAGVVDSIDSLTAMVQTEHVDRVKKGKKTRHLQDKRTVPGAEALGALPPEARQALELMKDKKRWAQLENVINAVVIECVLEPTVLPIPDAESSPVHGEYVRPEAGEGKFFVDQVAVIDRFAIFGEAMRHIMAGQAAMTPFREGPEETVAGVGSSEDVQQPAERTAGDS